MSQGIMNILAENRGKSISVSVTRPNDTTAYAANDVIGTATSGNLTFTDIVPRQGAGFLVLGSRLRIDVNAVPSGMAGFRLHLYNAAPTAIADNAAFNLPSGDRTKYLGYITMSTPVDFGDTLVAVDDNMNFSGKCADGSTTIYGMLETLGAYTPAASTVKTVTLNAVGV